MKDSSDEPGIEEATDGEGVVKAVVSYLRAHRDWYAKASAFHYVSLSLLTSSIIVFGALTSIISALDSEIFALKVLTIVLPALSALAATILVQFRVREMCRARELGRLACEGLICDALALDVSDVTQARSDALSLRRRAHALEREQLDLVIGGTTTAALERSKATKAGAG